MIRGPKPTPTALKMLAGNPGGRSLNLREPKPRGGAPHCPRWLKGEARKEWRRVAPELKRLGVLTSLDRAALAMYCEAWAWWLTAKQALEREGLTFTTPTGSIKARPEVAIMNQAAKQAHALACELGLTPSSRTRLDAGDADADPTDRKYGLE